MAYRRGEQARWLKMDFVVGYEIKRSNNPYPCPLCEALAGKYPKDFVWSTWHPHCRCYAVPILKTEDEMDEPQDKPSANEVRTLPEGFVRWAQQNRPRLDKMQQRGTLPLFIKENAKYFHLAAGNKAEGKKPAALERAKARHAQRTPQQIQEIKQRWEKRILKHQRKEVLAWGKSELVGTSIHHPKIEQPIRFTTTGLKEAINQPHKYIKEKNEAIKSIRERIQRGEYIGSKEDDKGRKIVFHYITTTIAGEQSLIVLKENEEGLLFYSITEKR